jgi:hypothetical protein
MIKFKAMAKNGRTLLGFGITDNNIRLLKEGHPIKMNMMDLGLKGLDVTIFYGGNDKEMIKTVEDNVGIKLTEMKEVKESEDEKRKRKSPLN